MFPSDFPNDQGNSWARNIKEFCQLKFRYRAGFMKVAYAVNSFIRQFGISSSFSASVSTLRHHVVSVFLPVPKEKMVWINAGADIALMKNPQAIFDRPVRQFPRESVSRENPRAEKTFLNRAISAAHLGPCPYPAGVSFSDFGPESVWNRDLISSVNAFWHGLKLTLKTVAFNMEKVAVDYVNILKEIKCK